MVSAGLVQLRVKEMQLREGIKGLRLNRFTTCTAKNSTLPQHPSLSGGARAFPPI